MPYYFAPTLDTTNSFLCLKRNRNSEFLSLSEHNEIPNFPFSLTWLRINLQA